MSTGAAHYAITARCLTQINGLHLGTGLWRGLALEILLARQQPLEAPRGQRSEQTVGIAKVVCGYGVADVGPLGHTPQRDPLDAVARLFENRCLLLAEWVHCLAFDLLIRAWEVRTARREGIAHGWLLPCLAAPAIPSRPLPPPPDQRLCSPRSAVCPLQWALPT